MTTRLPTGIVVIHNVTAITEFGRTRDLDRHQDQYRQGQHCHESDLDKQLQFHENVKRSFNEFHFDPVS